MKILSKSYDGGPDSGVTGFWLIEFKPAFSIVLLHFNPGSRDAYHSHAFNAVTLWLKGRVTEENFGQPTAKEPRYTFWKPGQFKFTRRNKFHRVIAGHKGAWALSFRGPWESHWQEHKNNRLITLTHGRIEVK